MAIVAFEKIRSESIKLFQLSEVHLRVPGYRKVSLFRKGLALSNIAQPTRTCNYFFVNYLKTACIRHQYD